MRTLVAIFTSLFIGCHPRPIPTVIDMAVVADMSAPAPPAMQACPVNVLAVLDDSCDGFFTKEHLACARCPGGGACYDSTDVVYCAAGGSCFNDPLCIHVKDQP